VPLVAETGKFQTVALVQAKNGHVVIGSSSNPSPAADAFAQYAAFLGVAGAAPVVSRAGERALSGVIDRVAASNGMLYFTLRGGKAIFALNAADEPAALLARSGDRVRFRSVPAAGAVAGARAFRDADLSAAP
jgi:hypothetical protein